VPKKADVKDLPVLPYNLEAEQATLGAMMLDPGTIGVVEGILNHQAFYRHDHRVIYEAILALHEAGEPIDVVTVGEHLVSVGEADTEVMAYLGSIAKDTPSAANVDAYAEIVQDKYHSRQVIDLAKRMSDMAHQDAHPGDLVKELVELDRARATGKVDLGHYVQAADLDGMEFSMTWLVESLIEQGKFYEFFGKWKSGKTLAVMDMCAHLSAGMTWGDRRTEQAMIVYVAGEGVDDVQRRYAAWRLNNQISEQLPFFIRTVPAYLTESEYASHLAKEIKSLQGQYPDLPVIVVVDTVARNFGPGKEENGAGMSDFANNILDYVVRPLDATVIAVHHSGHGDSERSRGHSSFAAALDGSIKVSKEDSHITVATSFSRNTEGGDELHFRIVGQELPGQDNFGSIIAAPVLKFDGDYQPVDKKPKGKHEQSLIDMIATRALDQFTRIATTRPVPEYVIVSGAEIREAFKENLPDSMKDSTRKNTWERARRNVRDSFPIVGDGFQVTADQCGYFA